MFPFAVGQIMATAAQTPAAGTAAPLTRHALAFCCACCSCTPAAAAAAAVLHCTAHRASRGQQQGSEGRVCDGAPGRLQPALLHHGEEQCGFFSSGQAQQQAAHSHGARVRMCAEPFGLSRVASGNTVVSSTSAQSDCAYLCVYRCACERLGGSLLGWCLRQTTGPGAQSAAVCVGCVCLRGFPALVVLCAKPHLHRAR